MLNNVWHLGGGGMAPLHPPPKSALVILQLSLLLVLQNVQHVSHLPYRCCGVICAL